tara:strand:+ start:16301 stop:18103 length:1803 start_codon:yes stop_codon:yes gene_type:complete
LIGFFTRFGQKLLGGGKGVAQSGVRASGGFGRQVGGTALGYGIGDAVFGAPEPINAPGEAGGIGGGGQRKFAGAGMGGGISSAGTGVSASQATSTLSDVSSRDPVVNQLQDIEKVLVDIKGDTAVMASGLSAASGPAVESENSIRARLGMGGGKGSGMSSGMAAGLGGLAAAQAMGLFDNLGGGEKAEEASEALRNRVDESLEELGGVFGDLSQRITKNLGKIMSGVPILTETLDNMLKPALQAVGKGVTTLASKLPKPPSKSVASSLNAAGQPKSPTSNVIDINTKQPIDAPRVNTPPIDTIDARSTINSTPVASANDNVDVKMKKPKLPKPDPKMMAKSFTKHVGKFGLKAIPIIGAGAGLGFAISRLFEGDFAGAGAEAAGMFVPSVAGSLTIDAGLLARDIYNDAFGTEEDPRPHDAHASLAAVGDFPAYKENYGMIMDFVQEKLAKLMEGDGTAPPRPSMDNPGLTGGNVKAMEKKQASWDEQYGATHNPDGTLKMNITETSAADMAPIESTQAGTSPTGPTTINMATSEASAAEFGRSADAAAASQNQLASEIRTATMPSTGSGVGATKVEKIGVYRDTSSQMVDPETKLLMQD